MMTSAAEAVMLTVPLFCAVKSPVPPPKGGPIGPCIPVSGKAENVPPRKLMFAKRRATTIQSSQLR